MNVALYLKRIAYSGTVVPDATTLRHLQRAHLLTVPFENLDIGWQRKIRLSLPEFVIKIVRDGRGGFCYELNGAFGALLEQLGFRVTLLSARAPRSDGSEGPEFDHLTLLVDLDEPWLVDVGFGDSFLDPLALKIGVEHEQYGKSFRIVQLDKSNLRLERKEAEGSWKTEYVFTLKPRQLGEFTQMCEYHQTSTDSPFTQKRICSRATPDGRITLSDMKLIRTRQGSREVRILNSSDEWWTVLKEEFGISRP